MAVFVELVTDAFEKNMTHLAGKYAPSERAGLSNVRRPLRGIEVKEDTYAMIKIIRADGIEVPLVDSSDSLGISTRTASFLLQSVQEARMEKHQIIETFGEPYIYFFGEAPRFIDCQAMLINSLDFNWEAEWWDNWENKIRGTKTVELGARTYLFYDDTIIEGYMLMAQAVKVSDSPFIVNLTWRMFVTNYRNISFIGDPNYPIHANLNIPPNINLGSADAFEQLTQLYAGGVRGQDAVLSFGDDISRIDPNDFGSRGKLTRALLTGTRSIAFPPDIQQMIDTLVETNAQDLPELDVYDRLTRKPIRSKIADNTDEYTGKSSISPDITSGLLPEMIDPRIRTAQESHDLFIDAIRWMSCFGANANSHTVLYELGLGVSFFNGGGVNIGFGRSTSTGATFSPVTQGGVGFAPTVSGFAVADIQDPIFGSSGTYFSDFTYGDSIDLGYGDPAYGYPSPYGGPGFGQVGYGDYGGLSYGSAFGAGGDPGYLPPDQFTFAGVEDERDAFERFVAPNLGYGSGFGGYEVGASYAAPGVGAVISIGGSPTAFSIVALPGTLDITGQAVDPSLNPFGVSCETNHNLVNILDLI